MRHIAVWCLLTVTTSLTVNAAAPDPAVILQRAREAYEKLKSFEIKALTELHTTGEGFEQTMKSTLTIAAEQPRSVRIAARGMGNMLKISNGTESWTFNGFLKQYTKGTATESIAHMLGNSPAGALLPEPPGQSTGSAKLIGNEALTVGGQAHSCYVLEVEHRHTGPAPPKMSQHPARVWIDRDSHLVLKRVMVQQVADLPGMGGPAQITTTFTVERLRVNEPVEAALFTFNPPEGSRLVSEFEYPGMKKADLIGKPAPDFSLPDLAGKPVRLADYRGKTVVLNFWTTWCGPCRAEMPVLSQLAGEFPEAAVLGVNVGENDALVRRFIEENKITYPILLGGSDRMLTEYAAQVFPTTVVIGPDGVVKSYKTGFGSASEQELRVALAAARQPRAEAAPATAAAAIRVGPGVTPPVVIHKREPEFTDEARRARVSGSIAIEAIISEAGVPGQIKVVRGLGHGLDEKAIEAVREWRFRPGLKDGSPVAVHASIEVNFRVAAAADYKP